MTTQRINEKVGALLLGGMNRDQLSEKLGMTKRSLYNRTSGKSKWEWEEVVRLSELADCTLDELVDANA